jgi:hypothetical protein
MAEISEDWNAEPKDSSVIYVKFSEGPPVKATLERCHPPMAGIAEERLVEIDAV